MNKIKEVSLFSHNGRVSLNIWRASSDCPRRHEIKSDMRGLTIQKILNRQYTTGSTMIFYSSLIVHYYPKPVVKVVEQHEIRRENIRKAYEAASLVSNTDPIRASVLYMKARAAEINWHEEYWDILDEDESIMPDSFFLEVVPLIKSRAAAATRGKES